MKCHCQYLLLLQQQQQQLYIGTKKKIRVKQQYFSVKKQTQVTSLVEGELSEPEDVVLDSSSADMDFPFCLCYRAK